MPKLTVNKTNQKIKIKIKVKFLKASKKKRHYLQKVYNQTGSRQLVIATTAKKISKKSQWNKIFKAVQENNYEQSSILK